MSLPTSSAGYVASCYLAGCVHSCQNFSPHRMGQGGPTRSFTSAPKALQSFTIYSTPPIASSLLPMVEYAIQGDSPRTRAENEGVFSAFSVQASWEHYKQSETWVYWLNGKKLHWLERGKTSPRLFVLLGLVPAGLNSGRCSPRLCPFQKGWGRASTTGNGQLSELPGAELGALDTSTSTSAIFWRGKLRTLNWANTQLLFSEVLCHLVSLICCLEQEQYPEAVQYYLNHQVYYLLVLIKCCYFFLRGRKFLTLNCLIENKWAFKRYIIYSDLIYPAQKIPIHELLIWHSTIRYVSFVSYFKSL